MEESSRNTQAQLEKDLNNGINNSSGSDDQAQISPKSLEGFQNIASGISKLVDEVPSPQPDESKLEQQMNNLTIQGHQPHQMSYDPSGTPGFFMQGLEYQERIQGVVQGVNDFQHPYSLNAKPSSGKYSRQSSDGEGMGGAVHYNRLDLSELAVFGAQNSANRDDNYSTSDYQEQIEKYGYIFQSPDFNARGKTKNNQNVYQSAFQSQGYLQNPHWEPYHQQTKPSQGFQNRASSFDKVNTQNAMMSQQNNQNYGYNNEDLETHSVFSSGGHSAFSEGDAQNQIYHTPNQYAHNAYGGYQGHGGMIPSNQASYGFTPNIQFTGSNQKYQGSYSMHYSNESGNPHSSMPNDALTPNGSSPFTHHDIQITDKDVTLQKFQIGISPRRNSNEFRPTQKLIGSAQHPHQANDYSNDKGHHHTQMHTLYKTPSPYRNNDNGFNPNIGHSNSNQRAMRTAPGQMTDPFYPSYGFQNQRMMHDQSYAMGRPFYPSHRGGAMMDQQYGNTHIGMNPPPMTRNLKFPSNDQHFIHGGPMIAIQPNSMHQMMPMHYQMPGQHPIYPPHKGQSYTKQTGSQERDPNYQPPNFVPHSTHGAKSGMNTPSHLNNSHDHKSVSSQNSSSSQQFSNQVPEHNEALFNLMKQFEECQNTQQKLELLKGNVHKLALTQKGSRFLQKQVQKASSNAVQFFLEEINPYLSDLMVDNYGNYFCQNLLQSCSGDQRLTILKGIGDKFIDICCDRKGTHTIQKMFELVNLSEEEDYIKEALTGNIITLSKNAQGTHVVQKILGSFSEAKRAFIFEEVYDQFIDLAKDTNGLCVVKKMVQLSKSPEQIETLMKKIQENAVDLVQDPFGNYAITEVINKWDPEVCRPIYQTLLHKISQLSAQKFSSNVIERCLERADDKMRSQLIEELAKSDRLTSLIRNQFGNYVVQKALKLAYGPDKDQLIHYIKQCIPDITDKKIREKWEKIIYDAVNGTSTASQGGNINDTTSQGSNNDGSHSHRQVMMKENRRANSSDGAAQQ